MTRRDDLVGEYFRYLLFDEGKIDANQVIVFQGYSG